MIDGHGLVVDLHHNLRDVEFEMLKNMCDDLCNGLVALCSEIMGDRLEHIHGVDRVDDHIVGLGQIAER